MKSKQKYFVLVLVGCLLISLTANVIQARQPRQMPVRGTFLYADIVLVFSPRPLGADSGLFFMYREWEVLAEGHYAYLGGGIYELHDRDGAFIKQALHRGDYMYTFHQNNEIVRFRHFDRVGMFTSIRPDEDFWRE